MLAIILVISALTATAIAAGFLVGRRSSVTTVYNQHYYPHECDGEVVYEDEEAIAGIEPWQVSGGGDGGLEQ